MNHKHRHSDGLCALRAAEQDGAISIAQMHGAGLSDDAIRHRRRAGRIHPIHRGVYAWGHETLGPRGRLWAAHLATDGALSHTSAAWDWRLLDRLEFPLHVTTTARLRSRRGIRVHVTPELQPEDVVLKDGLPITTVERTIADLPQDKTARAIREARYLELLHPGRMTAVLARHPAATRIGKALERNAQPHRTRSPLEHRLLDVIAAHDLPQPLVNTVVHGKERDFYWPAHRLVVETDGRQHREAWREDRRRDRELLRHGIATVRFTGDDTDDDMARTLKALLVP